VTGLEELRGSIIGLLGFAATEEQMDWGDTSALP
jgi:hypothetical protein